MFNLYEWYKNRDKPTKVSYISGSSKCSIPPELYDIMKVYEMGARKHGANSYLEPDGPKSSHKDMHASMFRHLAESSAGEVIDYESGLHPLLHLAARAIMAYTRYERDIVHSDDIHDWEDEEIYQMIHPPHGWRSRDNEITGKDS
jgi:hypothetical protein